MKSSALLVSCLFDLSKREPDRSKYRTIDDYLSLASRFLLKQTELPVLVYCDPELAPKIPVSANVTVVPFDISPFASKVEKINICLERGFCNQDRGKKKDTAWYTLVGWLKPHLLKLASTTSVLPYDFYCWIDFGINHVADTAHWPACLVRNTWNPDTDKIRLLGINPTCQEEAKDILSYLARRKYKVGGGFWVVPNRLIDTLYNEFERIVQLVFGRLNFVTLEDELVGLLACQRGSDLFQPHRGDYQDILNIDRPRHPASLALIARQSPPPPPTPPTGLEFQI